MLFVCLDQSFAEVTGIYPKGIIPMLKHFELPLLGNLHSGIGMKRHLLILFCLILSK